MRSIKIIEPGPLATVQDRGRFGFRSFGVPVSGAMDVQALRIGNLLVGNDEGLAGVEITMGGFRAEFCGEAAFALSGAPREAWLNARPISFWRAHGARSGDVLTVGDASFRVEPSTHRVGSEIGDLPFRWSGSRIYLAVSGGIDVRPVMGSRATYLPGGFGGLGGRRLLAGDRLPLGHQVRKPLDFPAPVALIPKYSGRPVLRCVAGPQVEMISDAGWRVFFSGVYEVTDRVGRMGMALAGPKIELNCGADIISDGVSPGAVQVSGDGQPMLLGADCQTTGGYAKIAVVVSSDLPLAAQLGPGDRVEFEEISLWEAREIYLRNEYLIRNLFRRIPGGFRRAAGAGETGS